MKINILIIIINCLVIISVINAQSIAINSFDSFENIKLIKSDNVEIDLSGIDGIKNKALNINYKFVKGTGYAGIQFDREIDLSDDFEFTFYIKANSPNNNFEIKFLDQKGENVWWVNNVNYEFPKDWKKVRIKRRQINFAWGPAYDKTLRKISKIEFTIASFNGGSGSVQIDDLQYKKLSKIDISKLETNIIASANSNLLKNIKDNNLETYWTSKKKNNTLIYNFGYSKEIGGITFDWFKNNFAKIITISISDDNSHWDKILKVNKATNYKSFLKFDDIEAQYLKLDFSENKKDELSISEIKIQDADWSADINKFFINIAKEYPRGYFPKYLNAESSFWTITGVNEDVKETLINEEGMIESDKQGFSIEPFIFSNGKLYTWSDASISQHLMNDYLPIPSVKWTLPKMEMNIETFTSGAPNQSSAIFTKYTLKNISQEEIDGNLYLAIRPFQVNPYYQFLNGNGGAAKVKTINYDKEKKQVNVNDIKKIISLSEIDSAGFTTFYDGDIINYISNNILPANKNIVDEFYFGSGALKYQYKISPNEEKEIVILLPMYENIDFNLKEENVYETKLMDAVNFWNSKVNNIEFSLPESADKLINVLKSNIAYILINRDKFGIQPGSRSYDRSWIRDGSLTSSALLKMGLKNEVKEFANWYSNYIFANGKVPCVVDKRGPDSVPENDSHGEYIYLIKEYFNFTKDTTFLSDHFEKIKLVMSYIKYLTDQRSTEEYKSNDSLKMFYGLVPESISHEGYSAKPMHSYWDDFFILKGMKDAISIAEILNKTEVSEFIKQKNEFEKNLYSSIDLTTSRHKINYIPGCAELGDFDATSTTIALTPCNEIKNLRNDLLTNTFDKYYDFFKNRMNENSEWLNYTPYEVRTIGSFVLLDKPEIAHTIIDYFLQYQKPENWNHWAEIVWHNSKSPNFIGDMPHTWVGSDFINSIRNLFVYEDELNNSLIIAPALYDEWIDNPNGMSVKNLPTYYGKISYSIKNDDEKYTYEIYGDLKTPENMKYILRFSKDIFKIKKILINNVKYENFLSDEIMFKSIPTKIEIYF